MKCNQKPILKSSPTNQKQSPDSAQNSGLKSAKSIERVSIEKSFRASKGSMTVEACLLLPICLFFFLNIGSMLEIIRLHNQIQMGLYEVGNSICMYACSVEESSLKNLMTVAYAKNQLVNFCGEDYLEQSPLKSGSKGLQFQYQGYMPQNDELNLSLSYTVAPFSDLAGFGSFRMKNQYVIHRWNGYEIDSDHKESRLYFITRSGEVYHTTRTCSYLTVTIQQISLNEVTTYGNTGGRRYSPCDYCGNEKHESIAYITKEGNAYHFNPQCSGLKRTVYAVEEEEAKHYRPCSKCAKEE